MNSEAQTAKKFLTKPRKAMLHNDMSDFNGMTIKVQNGSIHKLFKANKFTAISMADNERFFEYTR